MDRENIQYEIMTRDGKSHKINVRGAANLTEAVFEVAALLMKGGLVIGGKTYKVDDIIAYGDIPG